jgi:hypothetical protein
VSSDAATEILIRGARALAHADGPGSSLDAILAVLTERLAIESAVVVTFDRAGGPSIVAASGLGDAATAGLLRAVGNPAHPVPHTMTDPGPSFDVLPTQPGGPALRSHLPLAVSRSGTRTVLGVLALAHQDSVAADSALIEAAADLAAVALEREVRSS